ncbi:MAG: hypothetical protein NTW93_05210 [Phycisphaerae bacterium]|jgi:hypothetical protein|nr:hypothetical protein [Phycisphaerae bacterium]
MKTKSKTKTVGKKISRKDQIKKAKACGIDVSALTANLRRTPYERIMRHQVALDTFLMLRKAKRI